MMFTKSKWPSVAHCAFTLAPSCSTSRLTSRIRDGLFLTVWMPSGVSVESMMYVGTASSSWVAPPLYRNLRPRCGVLYDDAPPSVARGRRGRAARPAGGRHRRAPSPRLHPTSEKVLRLGVADGDRARGDRRCELHAARAG